MIRLLSALVIYLTPIAILVWDTIAYFVAGNDSTISRIALDTSQRYPSFKWSTCYLFGLLCVHLFSPRPGTGSTSMWLPVAAFVGVPLIVAFVNLTLYIAPVTMGAIHDSSPPQTVAVWLLIGVTVGWFTVAQHLGA